MAFDPRSVSAVAASAVNSSPSALAWLAPGAPRIRRVDPPRRRDGRIDLARLVGRDALLLLESSPGVPGAGPWSVLVTATAGRLWHDGDTTWLTDADGRQDLGPDPFAAIDRVSVAMEATPDDPCPPDGPPFVGGLAGAFAYDLGRCAERVPRRARADRGTVWLDLRVVTALIAVDHRDETAWHVQRPLRHGPAPAALRPRLDRILHATPAPAAPAPAASPLSTSLPHDAYRRAIDVVLDHVAAGEVFQVNLAQRLTSRWDRGPVELYRALRGASPAPHGAVFLRGRQRAIASISPESFLLARGRHVITRPIKGTRPRHATADRDLALRDRLVASPKDRAENVMVVDMERNDLGRVCRYGTVRTPALVEPEAHPTVWQLVSTVTGQLRDDVGWGGLLRATFPSGSITGTPKVRAMELIERLEPVRRSWYCGAIGWIGPGSASLSVAIRTAVLDGTRVDYAAGGGIVADSDPDAEIAESWAKAAPFLAAVGARVPRELGA